jgi:hypothetical protein
MPNLKAVEFGFNRFCGPSVLSILTGRSTDDCAKAITKVNGMYDVRGVYTKDLLEAAKVMGFKSKDMYVGEVSLYRALMSIARTEGLYIVTVTGHFVCVEVTAEHNLYFCDNHTKEPIPAASSARLGMQVVSVHKVEKDPDWKEPELPKVIDKPQFTIITLYECKICQARGESPEVVIHYRDCKYGNQS